jgi:hypothetical protein
MRGENGTGRIPVKTRINDVGLDPLNGGYTIRHNGTKSTRPLSRINVSGGKEEAKLLENRTTDGGLGPLIGSKLRYHLSEIGIVRRRR